MKILLITDSLVSGGKERQIVELLKGLSEIPHLNCYLIILSDVIFYEEVKRLDVDITTINRDHRSKHFIFKQLYRKIKGIRPDVIHSWESMCSMYAAPIARLMGIKFINGMIRYAPTRLNASNANWRRARMTFPLSDIILSNSHAGLRSYGVPSGKSCCIHNGFDPARINRLPDADEVKRKFNIDSPFIVGMVARFHARKDYRTFILAANRILEQRNDVTFLAVGDGTNLEACKALVPPRFKDRIKFLGRQKEIESIINIFDIGVLASIEEGISNSIMEYMALQKPVIATRDGGNTEIVKDGETGFLVDADHPEMLAGKINFILDHPDIGAAMGRAGNRRLTEEFNLNQMVQNFYGLYRSCLEGGSQISEFHVMEEKK